MMKKHSSLLIWTFVFAALLCFGKTAEAKPIYTTDPRTDAVAEKIIRECTDEKMCNEEKLYYVYMYLVRRMHYSWDYGSTKIHVSKKEIARTKALGRKLKVKRSRKFHSKYKSLRTLSGTCYGQNMAFCILANHLGYKAGMVHGTHVTGGGSWVSPDHYWCYVKVRGKKRYCDVQFANKMYHKNHKAPEVLNGFMACGSSSYWSDHYYD